MLVHHKICLKSVPVRMELRQTIIISYDDFVVGCRLGIGFEFRVDNENDSFVNPGPVLQQRSCIPCGFFVDKGRTRPEEVSPASHRDDELEDIQLFTLERASFVLFARVLNLDDGGIEYFNTIVVQPHLKLVTNQGRGFHIRCRYNTRNNTVMNDSLKVDLMSADPVTSLAPMPGCSMKIFSGDPTQKEVAENVKIGDPLTLVIAIDEQDTYGIRITDCLVRDGLGWGEQRLINNEGCPTDSEIMGMFKYSADRTKASVHFQAHKFPYTASVYYQCNVKLCTKADDGCDAWAPSCGGNRLRRQAKDQPVTDLGEGTPATIEVYSGLYVNEANELAKQEDDSVYSERTSDSICISQKNFAIGICVAGLLLMLCVVAAILCLLARRRKKTTSHLGSSIYSGPYTNTAYSHTS
ncbi:hypothetical protein NQ318_018806 [Aromia moschata]|uniref:ZP domain-containing protein n=1 Tax=Aromia moschata TaxID=1265417 RepID=A0AAV8ZG66_9CUCU|nr:hypothetical protein NQ318_018806 [Aromia moschata]